MGRTGKRVRSALVAVGAFAIAGCSDSCSEPSTTLHSGQIRVTQSPYPAIAGEAVTIDLAGTYFAGEGSFSQRCPNSLRTLTFLGGRQVGTLPLTLSGTTQTIEGRERCILGRSTVTVIYPRGTPGTTRTERILVSMQREDTQRTFLGDQLRINRLEGSLPVRVLTPADPPSEASRPPVAAIQVSPSTIRRGGQVLFDGRGSYDLDGQIVRYSWDLDLRPGDLADGTYDGTFEGASYQSTGQRTVTLTVTDDDGQTDSESVTFTVRDGDDGGGGCTYMCRATAAGRPPARLTSVRLSLISDLVTRGRLSAGVLGRRAEGVIVRGRMTGRLARRARVPSALRDLYRSTFAGRFDFDQVFGRRDSPLVGRGTILARSRRDPSTRVCLRITGDGRRENLGRNRFRVVGGTGDARRLRAVGTFPLPREANVRGRFAVRAYNGRARGLPRDCRALRRHLPRRR